MCLLVRVCVWNIWKDVKLPLAHWWLIFVVFSFWIILAGASGPSYLPDATKLWYDGGRVNWSFTCTCRSWHGCRGHSLQDHFDNLIYFRWWQPAKPRTGTSIFATWGLSTALLSQSGFIWLFTTGSATSEHSSEQGRRKVTSHWHSRWINQFFLADFKGLFSARVMHSTTKFAMLFLSKCVRVHRGVGVLVGVRAARRLLRRCTLLSLRCSRSCF